MTSKDIALLIKIDMESRSSGDAWWDEIDEEIQEEILDEWAAIIERHRLKVNV